MDNLASLIEKKQYDLVLSLTERANDATSLFYRTVAYLELGKAEEAMRLLLENRDFLYQDSPIRTMKVNFELRFILKEFDEAYEDAKYFSNLPYVSQEVEEYLRDLPSLIRVNERQSSIKPRYSDDEVREILEKGKDPYEGMAILTNFNDAETIHYADSIAILLAKSDSSILKTFALLLLVKAKYDKEVFFEKNGKSYHLIPRQYLPPYGDKNYHALVKEIQDELKDPSMFEIAKNLVNNFLFEYFPDSAFSLYPKNLLAAAFIILSHDYLKVPFEEKGLLKKYGLAEKEVRSMIVKITEVLNAAERMRI